MSVLPVRIPQALSPNDLAIPAIAFNAGYLTRTFGKNVTLGVNLFDFNFFSNTNPAGSTIQNSDGSFTCTGVDGNGYNAGVCSARHNSTLLNNWQGIAFGGGAYITAVLKFPAFTGSVAGAGWPSFWSDPIQGLASVPAFVQWQGQATGYQHSCETDFMEFDAGVINKYGISGHDWFGFSGSITGVSTAFPAVSTSADFSRYQTYAFLWIPATATTKGSLTWFFNGLSVGSLTYNKIDPTAPPPPASGTTAMSIIDIRHLCLIFGSSNPLLPMTVQSCEVWQKDSSMNLVQ